VVIDGVTLLEAGGRGRSGGADLGERDERNYGAQHETEGGEYDVRCYRCLL